jgi:hypothetical protein
MSEGARKEMFADWFSASKSKPDGVEIQEWYEENKWKIVLHDDTRAWVERKMEEVLG